MVLILGKNNLARVVAKISCFSSPGPSRVSDVTPEATSPWQEPHVVYMALSSIVLYAERRGAATKAQSSSEKAPNSHRTATVSMVAARAHPLHHKGVKRLKPCSVRLKSAKASIEAGSRRLESAVTQGRDEASRFH